MQFALLTLSLVVLYQPELQNSYVIMDLSTEKVNEAQATYMEYNKYGKSGPNFWMSCIEMIKFKTFYHPAVTMHSALK